MIKHTRKSLASIEALIRYAEADIARTKSAITMADVHAPTNHELKEYNWERLKREVKYLSGLQVALVQVRERESKKADATIALIEDLLGTQK